jgi:hypothetical protein
MKEKEAIDLNQKYPFLRTVLNIIDSGEIITLDNPLWDTYLIARQRGLVHRTGSDGMTIQTSSRAAELRSFLKS